MFGSQALELLIALATMMFVLALAASTIVEGIGAGLKRRAKKLEDSLSRLLGYEEGRPTVGARVRQAAQEAKAAPPADAGALPGLRAGFAAVRAPATVVATTSTISAVQSDRRQFPSNISRETFLDIALEVAHAEGPAKLQALLHTDTATAAGKKLLREFDEAMDRLSAAFKRRTNLWLFVVGLFIAVAGNVSIYHTAQSLWTDTVARQAVVEASKNIGSGTEGIDPDELQNVGATVDKLEEIGLPVGWTAEAKADWGPKDSINFKKLAMALGWLTTAALVTLGAPFWFDLMNKLIAKRGGGTPQTPPPDDGEVIATARRAAAVKASADAAAADAEADATAQAEAAAADAGAAAADAAPAAAAAATPPVAKAAAKKQAAPTKKAAAKKATKKATKKAAAPAKKAAAAKKSAA